MEYRDCSFVYLNHTLKDEKTLLAYGFTKEQDHYEFKKSLHDQNFYLFVILKDGSFLYNVKETSFNEPYIPYFAKGKGTSFVQVLKDEVADLVKDLIAHCFTDTSYSLRLIEYFEKEYRIPGDHPFQEIEAYVLRTTKKPGPWYALFMPVKGTHFGLGEAKVEIVNIKGDPATREKDIDNVSVFPAYHMNKKLWLTLVLDQRLPFEKAVALLEKSRREVFAKNGQK